VYSINIENTMDQTQQHVADVSASPFDEYLLYIRKSFAQLVGNLKEMTGEDEASVHLALVIAVLCFMVGLKLILFGAGEGETKNKKQKKESSNIAKGATPSSGIATAAAPVLINNPNSDAVKQGPTTPRNIVTTSSTTPASTPPQSPQKDPTTSPTSPQLLHSGILKKRQLIYKVVNSFELYKENEKSIVLYYTQSTTGTSPASAKKKSILYLGSDSHIDVDSKSKTQFAVHQLKSGGGKILKLEAKSAQERDEWVGKIQDAINQLKPVQ
jgi:hypothetical protein